MTLKDFCFEGDRELVIRDMPTDAGDQKAEKAALVEKTGKNMLKAAELQARLYAAKKEGLVIALQARDASGKDSLIKKVISRLNPAGLKVTSFKVPNPTDLAHDYMWRINRAMPERGYIGVFNRSHYEDVLIVRVHQMQKNYNMAERCISIPEDEFFANRYRQLRNWEQYLWENGFRMVKVFLNISKEEQKQRFMDRLELSEKQWKLSVADMKERELWDEYDGAFEQCINSTASKYAPWYVLPADNKWYTRYLMSEVILKTLEDMNPQYPPLDPEKAARIPAAIQELEQEL